MRRVDFRPLPERACVVKGGLCGFCRLGVLVFFGQRGKRGGQGTGTIE